MKNMEMKQLNADFRNVSKILFGSEIGELQDFEEYLKELMFPYRIVKSSVSGKEVLVGSPHYPAGVRFVSQDEIPQLKAAPLNVNEIKDIDSLFQAVGDRLVFCGNKSFGRNEDIEAYDSVVDSSNVYFCHNAYRVKNAAFVSVIREAESIYGASAFPKLKSSIRCMEGINLTRGFETYYNTNCSDLYYTFNCSGCSHCMFSFNQKGKSYLIGNLPLPKDRYLALKAKLAAEIGEKLRKDKRIFSILDLARMSAKEKNESEVEFRPAKVQPEVDSAFAKTTRVVLGVEHRNSERFAPYLRRHAVRMVKVKGAFGTPCYKVNLPIIGQLPAERLVTLDEGLKSGLNGIELGANETPSLMEIAKRASEKAYFTFEFVDGHSLNVVEVPAIYNATHCYMAWDCTNSWLSGYSSGVIESKYVFGGGLRILNSNFCINCYDVTGMKSSFETDSSYKCGSCYFCHNCEDVEEGMFCFNAKGLRYAVGNTEVGRAEYLRVKKILLDYVNNELDKKGMLGIDVFSLGKKDGRKKGG